MSGLSRAEHYLAIWEPLSVGRDLEPKQLINDCRILLADLEREELEFRLRAEKNRERLRALSDRAKDVLDETAPWKAGGVGS